MIRKDPFTPTQRAILKVMPMVVCWRKVFRALLNKDDWSIMEYPSVSRLTDKATTRLQDYNELSQTVKRDYYTKHPYLSSFDPDLYYLSRHGVVTQDNPLIIITTGNCMHPNDILNNKNIEEPLFSGRSRKEIQEDVINALENKNYNWRSINGIVRETHLPKGEICDMIKQLIKDGLVLRAPYRNKKGHRLYTTRKHYCQMIGPVGRLISTITNRIL